MDVQDEQSPINKIDLGENQIANPLFAKHQGMMAGPAYNNILWLMNTEKEKR
jgi:hypothetical protein